MLQLLRVANLKCFFDKHIESILMSNFFHNYICKNQNFLNDKGLKIIVKNSQSMSARTICTMSRKNRVGIKIFQIPKTVNYPQKNNNLELKMN